MRIKITVKQGENEKTGTVTVRDEALIGIRERNCAHIYTNKKKIIDRKQKYKGQEELK